MLTPEGAKAIARWMVDTLKAGSVLVSDGAGQEATTPITEARIETEKDGSVAVVVLATFGEGAANFEWAERRVMLPDGSVLDADETDAGRKVAGHSWDYEVTIDVSGA